jgi:uncharacterized membrane protein
MKRSILKAAATVSMVLSWRQFQSQQAQALSGSMGSHGD